MHRRTEHDNRKHHDHLPDNNPYDHPVPPSSPAARDPRNAGPRNAGPCNDGQRTDGQRNDGPGHDPTTPLDLAAHFGFLADTPGYEPLVERIFARARGHRWHGERLFVDFGAGVVLVAGPPNPRRQAGWPASFERLTRRHGYLAFPDEDGFGLLLGDDDIEPELLEDHELSAYTEVRAPLTDGSNWWLYHPERERGPGEPVLCLYSFERGIEEIVSIGLGALFLRRMAELLGLAPGPPSPA